MRLNCPICNGHHNFRMLRIGDEIYFWHLCPELNINVYWNDDVWAALTPGIPADMLARSIANYRVRRRNVDSFDEW